MSEEKGVPGKYKIMVMKEIKWETVARYTDGKDLYEKVKELQLQGKTVRIKGNQEGQPFDHIIWKGL